MRQLLIDLFHDTARAHHTAFAATDGADPDWPIWYAEHIQPRATELGLEFTKSQLVECLMAAELEWSARAPEISWAEFYADFFVERFAASTSPNTDKLALYMTPICPFCRLVLRAIDRLGIEVEMRDVFADRDNRDALVAARGRATVPVLRIISEDGERWMPESRDIVRYLEKTYG